MAFWICAFLLRRNSLIGRSSESLSARIFVVLGNDDRSRKIRTLDRAGCPSSLLANPDMMTFVPESTSHSPERRSVGDEGSSLRKAPLRKSRVKSWNANVVQSPGQRIMLENLDLQIVVHCPAVEGISRLQMVEDHLLATYRAFTPRQRADVDAAITVIALGLEVRV